MKSTDQLCAIFISYALLATLLFKCFRYHKIDFFNEVTPRKLSKADVLALAEASQPHSVLVDPAFATHIASLLQCMGLVVFWFDIVDAMRLPSLLVLLLIFFFPYLQKPSKFYPHCSRGVFQRAWGHLLMSSSWLYAIGAFASFVCAYYQMALLSLLTTLGSLLYHRHREGQCFNFDNIFATAQLFLFLYTLLHATGGGGGQVEGGYRGEYSAAGFLSLPLALFVFAYCGDPAQISLQGAQCTRHSRGVYNLYHSLWHVLSALGPAASCLYLHLHPLDAPPEAANAHPYLLWIEGRVTQEESLVVTSLSLSVGLNLLLNFLSIAPLA